MEKTGNKPFIMFVRNSQSFQRLIEIRPTAFVLLALIAQRARRTDDVEPGWPNLEVGEAWIGDYRVYGVTEEKYKNDKRYLKEMGLATFKSTNKGTTAKILSTSIFDINTSPNQRTNQPTSHELSNEIPTTNKKEKKNKENYSVDSKSPTRKSQSFPRNWYDQVLAEYQELKGMQLQGDEFKPVRQAIKTMFLSGRQPEQVLAVMRFIASQDYSDWTIRTVQMKLPEILPKLGVITIPNQSSQDRALVNRLLGSEGGSHA